MSQTTLPKLYCLFHIVGQNQFLIEIRLSVPFTLLVITRALQVGCDNATSMPGKGLMDCFFQMNFCVLCDNAELTLNEKFYFILN